MPRWQVVQRSTFGVPVKITSSWRFAVMIWLTLRVGFARSRMGRLRTKDANPGWIFRSFSSSRFFSANSSAWVFSAARRAHLPEGLLDLLPGQLDLEVVEAGLVGLPFAVVVRPHHQGEGDEEADGGEGEDEVQLLRPLSHLRITAGLDLGHRLVPSHM